MSLDLSFDEGISCFLGPKQECQHQSDLLNWQDFKEVFILHRVSGHRLMSLCIKPFLSGFKRLVEGFVGSLVEIFVITDSERVVDSCVEEGGPFVSLEQIRASFETAIVLMEI